LNETAPANYLSIATWNVEHGGRGPDGIVRLQPAIDHLAAEVEDLDLLFYQEANEYHLFGQRDLLEMAEMLHGRYGGTWHGHLAMSNAIFVRTEKARVKEAWPDFSDRFGRSQHTRPLQLHVDGLDQPLFVQSVHWRHNSGATRTVEASYLGTLIVRPTIIAGDFNSLWPDERELIPDWSKLSPHLRYHKTVYNPVTKKWETDFEAGHMLRDMGWVDAGALAGDFTVTTNKDSDAAPCRIDRIEFSPPLAAGIDLVSYKVHVPAPGMPLPSDHRIVSVRVDLSRYGEVFDAPWWSEERFGRYTYVGGDDSGEPNRYHGWVPR
jgi:endonuclease/exonuclease/phosphatase family metal-dependent hydrolase